MSLQVREPELRLLVVGEGATEVGHDTPSRPPDLGSAILPILFARIVSDISNRSGRSIRATKFCEARLLRMFPSPGSKIKIANRAVRLNKPAIKGKIYAALMLATTRKYDGVLFHMDRERYSAADFATIVRSVLQDTGFDLICAVANPCRSTETWLLVDLEAQHEVFGTSKRIFTNDPERRPAPQSLKKHLKELSEGANISVSDARVQLANALSVQTVEDACTRSFPQFVTDCHQFLE